MFFFCNFSGSHAVSSKLYGILNRYYCSWTYNVHKVRTSESMCGWIMIWWRSGKEKNPKENFQFKLWVWWAGRKRNACARIHGENNKPMHVVFIKVIGHFVVLFFLHLPHFWYVFFLIKSNFNLCPSKQPPIRCLMCKKTSAHFKYKKKFWYLFFSMTMSTLHTVTWQNHAARNVCFVFSSFEYHYE